MASDVTVPRAASVVKGPGPLMSPQPGKLGEASAHTPQKSTFCKWTLSVAALIGAATNPVL